jgi:hypothetical protein
LEDSGLIIFLTREYECVEDTKIIGKNFYRCVFSAAWIVLLEYKWFTFDVSAVGWPGDDREGIEVG